MDDHESSSIIMTLALWALLGVITLICWYRELGQRRAAIRWATQPLVDPADKGDGPESVQHGLRDVDKDLAAATDQAISLSLRPSVQHGLRDADMDLAALRLSSGDWRKFPSTDELKTYVDGLIGDAARQSNARLLALVLTILVSVIGTLVILAVWLSPTPEQIQAARNGQGKQGTQQSTPAGDAQLSLLGQYGEYEQSTFTPAPEQSAAAPAPEQSTSTPAPEQPRGWIAEVKKSRPICESADDYVQIQRMALRPSRKAMRRTVEFVKRKCPIITFKPGNHASVERTETFSIDKTRSITLACVVIKDGPCAWTDASALLRIPEEAPSTFTPAPEQSAAAPAPEQSTSTPAPEQPRGWIAEVKKSRPICESADDYVQIQRMALRPSRKAMRRTVEFVKRKCPIITFKPGNHVSVERTETFSIDKTRSITLACVVIKDGPCAWTDASALVRIPEEAPAKKSTQSDTKSMQDDVDRPQQSDAAESDKVLAAVPFSVVQIARDSRACWPAYSENCITLTKGEEVVVPPGMQITLNPRRGLYCLRPLRIRRTTSVHSSSSGSNEACSFTDDTSEIDQHPSVTGCATAAAGLDDQLPPEHRH